MPINETEKAHGSAILSIVERLGRDLPGKYFSLDTGESHSAYLITGFNPSNNQTVQTGLFIKFSKSRRSPWRYSFQKDHQDELKVFKENCGEAFTVFVNGDDGFSIVDFSDMKILLDETHEEQEWVAISREPRQGYRASGNDGKLQKPIPKNNFPTIIVDYFNAAFTSTKIKTKRKLFSFAKFEKLFPGRKSSKPQR